MVARATLRLLGGFEAEDADGRPLALATRKTEALLVTLALRQGRPMLRDALAALLWGDRMDAQARASLRQALTTLRHAVGDGLTVVADKVALQPDAVTCDAARFERLAASPDVADRAAAADLYRGDLLAGFDARAPAFDDWVAPERERLRGLAVGMLGALALDLARAGEGEAAAAAAQRLLTIEPAHEPAHRLLMRLHADAGRWDAASRQYAQCRAALDRALGVGPDAETEALRRSLATRTADAPAPAVTAPVPARCPIAVLAFRTVGADEDQRLLADGVASDLRIELARFRDLVVLGAGGDGGDDPREAGRRLGAAFVVEGAFRRAGERVRVGATLTEVSTGQQVWAERWDRDAHELFAVQDDLVRRIATIVAARLAITLHEHARRKRPQDLGAYECFLRGNRVVDAAAPEAQAEAQDWFERALRLDPGYARAHTGLAWAWFLRRNVEIGLPQDSNVARALHHAEAALALDPDDARVHTVLGFVCLMRAEVGRACGHFERALSLNPNDVRALVLWAWAQACVGDADAALRTMEAALALRDAWPGWCIAYHAGILFLAGRYDEALAQYDRVVEQRGPRHHAWRAATAAAAGRPDEARAHGKAFLAFMRGAWRGAATAGTNEFRDWFLDTVPLARPADHARLRHWLGAAGLDEPKG